MVSASAATAMGTGAGREARERQQGGVQSSRCFPYSRSAAASQADVRVSRGGSTTQHGLRCIYGREEDPVNSGELIPGLTSACRTVGILVGKLASSYRLVCAWHMAHGCRDGVAAHHWGSGAVQQVRTVWYLTSTNTGCLARMDVGAGRPS